MQVIVRFLTRTQGNCVFGCFQLDDHTGETLREGVVNIAGHSISFFENRSSATLLGKFIELKRKHDLMRERLTWSVKQVSHSSGRVTTSSRWRRSRGGQWYSTFGQ